MDNPINRESYFSAALRPFEDVAMTFIGLVDGSFYGARRLPDNTIQIVRNNDETDGNDGSESEHHLASVTQDDWMREILNKSFGVLLAEDSKANYDYIERVARKSHWHLFHSKNGEEAIVAFMTHREQIDVILMDLEMPVLDGYEAAKQIRLIEKKNGYSPMRIIAISANVLAGEREKCIEAGMDDYLVKPFRIEQLLAHFSDLENKFI